MKLTGELEVNFDESGALIALSFARTPPEAPPEHGDDFLPLSRRIDWSQTGIRGGILTGKPIYATAPAGSSLSWVQAILNNCPANHVVRLSVGTYAWVGDLDWFGVKEGVELRGGDADATKTNVVFNRGGMLMRHYFQEAALSVDVDLALDASKGATTITLASVPDWVMPGHIYIIDQLNDPAIAKKDGQEPGQIYRAMATAGNNGDRGIGQTVKVLSKTATTVTIEIPLYCDYLRANVAQLAQAGYNPAISTPLRNCGIVDMTISFNYSNGGAHAISMQCCDSCYVRNVRSLNSPGGSHVWPVFSYRCEVRDCIFDDSHLHGAGQGYGVSLYHMSCGWRVENNTFKKLHVAMQANYGSSGNVFGYNVEQDSKADAAPGREQQTAGMNFHGCHAYMNLVEGCTLDSVLGDYTHGSNGWNLIYRCRVTGHRPGMSLDQCPISFEKYSRGNTVAGCILGEKGWHDVYEAGPGSAGPPITDSQRPIFKIGAGSNWGGNLLDWGSDNAAVMNLLRHGNYDVVTSGVVWDSSIASRVLPDSFYLPEKPAWLGDKPWPLFDPRSPQ